MLSYELAKQLKEAGFEQSYNGGDYVEDPNAPEGEQPDGAYAPTLEELLQSCKDYYLLAPCLAIPNHWSMSKFGFNNGKICALGRTPSDAAAKYWLLYNKKNKKKYAVPYK